MSNPEFSTNEVAHASDRTKNFKVIHTNFPATGIPIGINLLDMWSERNPRIRAHLDGVSPANSGYDQFIARINLDTWCDTRLYGARCTWLDISKHSLDFQFGRVSSGNMKAVDDTKSKSIDIRFTRPYQNPLKVVIWLTSLDSDCTRFTRLDTSAENITTDGFKLVVNTWCDSIVYDSTVSWIAVSSDNPAVTAGRLMTAYTGPSSGFQQKILFDKPFKRAPRVMVALNRLDISNKANLRICAYPKEITAQGMTLVVDTWADSVICVCAVGFIAIDDAPASSKSILNLVVRGKADDDNWGFSMFKFSRELKDWEIPKVVEEVFGAVPVSEDNSHA